MDAIKEELFKLLFTNEFAIETKTKMKQQQAADIKVVLEKLNMSQGNLLFSASSIMFKDAIARITEDSLDILNQWRILDEISNEEFPEQTRTFEKKIKEKIDDIKITFTKLKLIPSFIKTLTDGMSETEITELTTKLEILETEINKFVSSARIGVDKLFTTKAMDQLFNELSPDLENPDFSSAKIRFGLPFEHYFFNHLTLPLNDIANATDITKFLPRLKEFDDYVRKPLTFQNAVLAINDVILNQKKLEKMLAKACETSMSIEDTTNDIQEQLNGSINHHKWRLINKNFIKLSSQVEQLITELKTISINSYDFEILQKIADNAEDSQEVKDSLITRIKEFNSPKLIKRLEIFKNEIEAQKVAINTFDAENTFNVTAIKAVLETVNVTTTSNFNSLNLTQTISLNQQLNNGLLKFFRENKFSLANNPDLRENLLTSNTNWLVLAPTAFLVFLTAKELWKRYKKEETTDKETNVNLRKLTPEQEAKIRGIKYNNTHPIANPTSDVEEKPLLITYEPEQELKTLYSNVTKEKIEEEKSQVLNASCSLS